MVNKIEADAEKAWEWFETIEHEISDDAKAMFHNIFGAKPVGKPVDATTSIDGAGSVGETTSVQSEATLAQQASSASSSGESSTTNEWRFSEGNSLPSVLLTRNYKTGEYAGSMYEEIKKQVLEECTANNQPRYNREELIKVYGDILDKIHEAKICGASISEELIKNTFLVLTKSALWHI